MFSLFYTESIYSSKKVLKLVKTMTSAVKFWVRYNSWRMNLPAAAAVVVVANTFPSSFMSGWMAPPVLRCDCNPGNYRVINCRVSLGVRGAGQRNLCGIRSPSSLRFQELSRLLFCPWHGIIPATSFQTECTLRVNNYIFFVALNVLVSVHVRQRVQVSARATVINFLTHILYHIYI